MTGVCLPLVLAGSLCFEDEEFELEADDPDLQGTAPGTRASLCLCGCGQHLVPGSIAYYKAHLDKPLYRHHPSSSTQPTMSTRQFIVSMMEIINEATWSKTSTDLALRLISVSMPRPNFVPPSMYMLKKVLDAPEWSDYEVHVCSTKTCTGHVFPVVKRSVWDAHKDDACPHCKAPRFRTVLLAGREELVPRAWYIDFGLENVIKQLFQQQEFCSRRGKASAREDHDRHDSYWQGALPAMQTQNKGKRCRLHTLYV